MGGTTHTILPLPSIGPGQLTISNTGEILNCSLGNYGAIKHIYILSRIIFRIH